MPDVYIRQESVDIVRRPAKEIIKNIIMTCNELPDAICSNDDQNSKSDASFVHLHIRALRSPARSSHPSNDQSVHDNDRQ